MPPDWYTVLLAAEAWGAPPWEIEEAASALWIDRFAAVRNAEASASAKPQHIAGSGHVTRLE